VKANLNSFMNYCLLFKVMVISIHYYRYIIIFLKSLILLLFLFIFLEEPLMLIPYLFI